MSAPLFARDSIGVEHQVAAADTLSARVTTLCRHPAFVPAERPTTKRPDADAYCQSCLDVEQRRAQRPAEQAAHNDSTAPHTAASTAALTSNPEE